MPDALRPLRLLSGLLHLAFLVTLAGTATAATDGEGAEAPAIIAEVNGVALDSEEFQAFINSRLSGSKPTRLDQEQIQRLLNEFINRELIYQDGLAQGVERLPPVVKAIDNQRRNIVASYRVRQIVSREPDEKTLEAIYAKQFDHPLREYKLRHILLDDEETARQLIAQLDLGESFAELANKHSKDTSGSNGGELAWLSSEQMIPAFRQAVEELQPGEYTGSPLKSSYGWHVILLEKVREVPPPPFEKVRDEIVSHWQQQTLSRYLKGLREKSRVVVK